MAYKVYKGRTKSILYDSIDNWMTDPKRYRGTSSLNVKYLRAIKELLHDNSVLGTLTYFVGVRLGVKPVIVMMRSASAQKNFLRSVYHELKEWIVLPRHAPMFNKNIEKLQQRKEYIFKICKENIRLTPHHLYFEAIGYDKLLDFDTAYTDDNTSVLDPLLADMEVWEKEHADEIEAYMESIRPELERREAFKQRRRESYQAEKEKEREEKRAEREEIKFQKALAKEEAKERRRLDRDLNQVINRNKSSEVLLRRTR